MIYHPLVNSWKTALVAPPTTNPIIAPIISVLIAKCPEGSYLLIELFIQ